MAKKIEQQEEQDALALETQASGQQPKQVEPPQPKRQATQAEVEQEIDEEDEMEERIKIALPNDEIDPEDVVEKDPRKALSLKQKNH